MACMDLGTIVLDLSSGMGSRRRTARIELPVSDLYPENREKMTNAMANSASWSALREAMAYVEGLPGGLLLTTTDARLRVEGNTRVGSTIAHAAQDADRTNANVRMSEVLDAIWSRVPVSETRPDRAWNRDDPMEVMRAVQPIVVAWNGALNEIQAARNVLGHFGHSKHGRIAERIEQLCGSLAKERVAAPTDSVAINVSEKRRLALDAIWTMISGAGADWTDPREVVMAVQRMLATPGCAVPGCTGCHGATCLHDNGCAHGHHANDVPAATEALRAVYVTRDPVHAFDGRPMERLTVDGKPLDQVRVVNVGTDPNGTDQFRVAGDPDALPMFETGEPPVMSLQAAEVARVLSDKAREVVKLLSNGGPQTTARILGFVLGVEVLLTEVAAGDADPMLMSASRWLGELTNLYCVQSVDRLPHDFGKPLMDRWTLTTLGREVARVLARG